MRWVKLPSDPISIGRCSRHFLHSMRAPPTFFCKGTRFPISARRVVMFVQLGRSSSWRLHQLAVQFTVCSCQMLRQFTKAKTMQLFQSTKCIHQVMQPVATTSGGAPAILGDAICTHVIINQSINQSSILLCKRSHLGWWALFFLLMLSSLGLLQLIRDSPFLVICSLDPANKGTYYNPCHQSLDITIMVCL